MTRSTKARCLARILGFSAVSFSATHSCRGSPDGRAALQISNALAFFVTMSSDEFKKDKKITPLRKREGLS